MKLKFGNVELTDWYYDYNASMRDFDCDYLNSSPAVYIAQYYDKNCASFVHFYGKLSFLQDLFKEDIRGDTEDVKEKVDKFLIRMNKLAVFL
jgi:hypothetical protein